MLNPKTDEEILYLDILPLHSWILKTKQNISQELSYVLLLGNDMGDKDTVDIALFRKIPNINPSVYREYREFLSQYRKHEKEEHKNSLLLRERIKKIERFFEEKDPRGPEILSQLKNESMHGKTYHEYLYLLCELGEKEPTIIDSLEKQLLSILPEKTAALNKYLGSLWSIRDGYTLDSFLINILRHDLPENILHLTNREERGEKMFKFLCTMEMTPELKQKIREANGDTNINYNNDEKKSGGSVCYPTRTTPSLDYYDNRRDRNNEDNLVPHEGQFMPTKAYNGLEYAQYLLDHQE